jgi:hypothetical protein
MLISCDIIGLGTHFSLYQVSFAYITRPVGPNSKIPTSMFSNMEDMSSTLVDIDVGRLGTAGLRLTLLTARDVSEFEYSSNVEVVLPVVSSNCMPELVGR